jgi:surface carbohydrate biosynthesis protein
MSKVIVLQAIDSPRRDTEWRIFMAAKLAERGISSIVGSRSAIRSIHARSKNCIFLGRLDTNTGRNIHDQKYVKEMEEKGTAFFFLHDEGALYYKGEYEEAVRRIYPEEYFESEAVKKVLFWGEAQRDIFKKSHYAEKFEISGSPRFDLCKPKFSKIDDLSVSNLKKKYGDFVLICGRFALVNMVADDPSALGKRSYDIRIEGGALKTKQKEEILRSMFGSWKKVSLEFSEFVPAIARLGLDFPDLNFVLRPHPAEKESFYKDAFGHFDNIFIDKSGDVRPFIRASKALVHSECTTGLEAELSHKPNINFRPCADHPVSRDFEVAGASDIGVIVKNYDELQETLSELITNDFNFLKSDYDASKLIFNSRENWASADFICSLIEDFSKGTEISSKIIPKYRSVSHLAYSIFIIFKDLTKKCLGIVGVERFKRIKISAGAGDLKFYQYTDEDIRALWTSLGSKDAELTMKDSLIYVDSSKSAMKSNS